VNSLLLHNTMYLRSDYVSNFVISSVLANKALRHITILFSPTKLERNLPIVMVRVVLSPFSTDCPDYLIPELSVSLRQQERQWSITKSAEVAFEKVALKAVLQIIEPLESTEHDEIRKYISSYI